MEHRGINKLKAKIDSLDPKKLIDDILTNSLKKTKDVPKTQKQDEFLVNLKKVTKANFFANIKSNAISDIKHEFEKRIDEYNVSSNLYIDKKNKEW